jgi:hypothetical protein
MEPPEYLLKPLHSIPETFTSHPKPVKNACILRVFESFMRVARPLRRHAQPPVEIYAFRAFQALSDLS